MIRTVTPHYNPYQFHRPAKLPKGMRQGNSIRNTRRKLKYEGWPLGTPRPSRIKED